MDMKKETAVTARSLFLYPSQHHAQNHESDLEEDYMEVSFILHRFIDTFINGELLSPFHRTTVTIYH
jgi:hypothetical protein